MCIRDRCAVIVVRAAIPLPIPRCLLDGIDIRIGLAPEGFGACGISAGLGMRSKPAQRRREKPCKPHALSLSTYSDAIHPVVPVSASHQRKSVLSSRCSAIQNVNAVIEHGCLER